MEINVTQHPNLELLVIGSGCNPQITDGGVLDGITDTRSLTARANHPKPLTYIYMYRR